MRTEFIIRFVDNGKEKDKKFKHDLSTEKIKRQVVRQCTEMQDNGVKGHKWKRYNYSPIHVQISYLISS